MSNSLFNPDYELIQIEDGMVTVAKTCSVSKVSYAVSVTEKAWNAWKGGKLAQEAFPELSPEDREFLISGMTPDEWDDMAAADAENCCLNGGCRYGD